MPNIASAKKNMRKSRAATVRNRAQRSALRTALKKANDPAASPDARLSATKLLDRAALGGQIAAPHRDCPADLMLSNLQATQRDLPQRLGD